MSQSSRFSLPEDHAAFVIENYKGRTTKELNEMLQERFGVSYNLKQLATWKHTRHLSSGVCTRFTPGMVPYTKGKSMKELCSPEAYEHSQATQFKKGDMPHNWLPVGSEVRKKGRPGEGYYWWIKLGEHEWQQKHRYLWEQRHKQKIPEGYNCVFLDGNRDNFSDDNLAIVSRNVHGSMNAGKRYTSQPEITKAYIQLSKLNVALAKKKRSKGE